MNRRTFLKAAVSLPLASSLAGRAFSADAPSSRVVIVRDDSLKPEGLAREACRNALRRAVLALTGKDDPKAAWSSLFKSSDVVAVKLSCLAGRQISPHPELALALADELHEFAAVPYANIILWDRTDMDLRRAGYKIDLEGKSGPKVMGTDSAGGYDSDVTEWGISDPHSGSCFSPIISKMATAVVSLGALKDHDLAGVSINLKNFYGAIHNPQKYHEDNCDPFVAELNAHPFIKGKLRLAITDAVVGLYNGGPSMKPQWSWNFGGIILGTDMVAVDAVCADIIEKKRAAEGMPPLPEVGRPPKHIQTAAKLGLGVADLDKIEVIKV